MSWLSAYKKKAYMKMLYRNIVSELKELLTRSEFRIGLALAFLLGALLLFLDVRVERPDWKGIQSELHAVFLEILLGTVVVTAWVHLRERREWKTTEPLVRARVLAACNAGVEAIAARVDRRHVYQFFQYDVPCTFQLDQLWPQSLFYERTKATSEKHPPPRTDLITSSRSFVDKWSKSHNGLIASSLLEKALNFDSSPEKVHELQQLYSRTGHAVTLLDSALILGLSLVNRGIEPLFIASVARLQYVLGELHRQTELILNPLSQGKHNIMDEMNDARMSLPETRADVLNVCFLVGGQLAATASKISSVDASRRWLDDTYIHVKHYLEERAGRKFSDFDEAASWALRDS